MADLTVEFATVQGEAVGRATFGADGPTGDEAAVSIVVGVWELSGRDPEATYTYYRSWSNGYLRSQAV